MPSEEFWRTVALAFQIVKLENDKKKAIEKVKDEGREVEEHAMSWKDEYPFLESISTRFFGKRTAALVHVFGCRSHPDNAYPYEFDTWRSQSDLASQHMRLGG